MSVRSSLGPLFHVAELSGTRWVALRAGLAALGPLLVLCWAGHLEWSLYATFGAFTALYGRAESHRARLAMQSVLAVMLTAAVALGAAIGCLDQRAWIAVPAVAVVAGLGSLVSDLQQWHPPGPLFLVFAVGATSSIPGEPGQIGTAALVAACSAAFALLVGTLGALWNGWGAAWRPAGRPLDRDLSRHVVRCVVAVAVAGAIATGVGIGRPYWAMVAAVVPLVARELHAQVTRAIQRVAGTTVGLVLAAVMLEVEMDDLVLVLVVALLMAVTEMLIGRNYGLGLMTITPLALLMVHAMTPMPTGVLLWDRWLETLIGAVVGAGIGYLTRDRSLSLERP